MNSWIAISHMSDSFTEDCELSGKYKVVVNN